MFVLCLLLWAADWGNAWCGVRDIQKRGYRCYFYSILHIIG